MNEPEVFVVADRTLLSVVKQIRDDQWDLPIPDWFARGSTQQDVVLRDIINYHAYDDAWVPDMLAGKTMAEAGATKFDGDLLGADPKGSYAAIVERAVDTVSHFTDLDRTVHCSFGDFTAREYFWQINMFRGLRARDIARLIGVSDRLPDALVQGIWDEIAPHAEEWRQIGVFGPQVMVPDDASLQDKLLALTGRQP
jgi:uncharacterized protein (TIGR03086 family)